jgi:hypothetical protein
LLVAWASLLLAFNGEQKWGSTVVYTRGNIISLCSRF